MHRAGAALIAIVCWGGLAVQFSATYGNQNDVAMALWTLARFFTILTNLLLAIMMTGIAIGRRTSPFVVGGGTLAILLVGAVYALLLSGLHELRGPALVADILLHKISPVLMALWWLLFAPRGKLKWSAPIWWSLYPLAYFAYALERASLDGKYPYPFMDVGKIGWVQTGLNALGIAMAFILAGLILVWLDGWRPLGSRRSSR
ncbi:MAG TPA: Pr6Pr family membrane protein [Sphingomicrobium sp.]|jgi:hypothetical protein|nr:Pr6Pr family membrane protein [Sphingomicrobium sp.]